MNYKIEVNDIDSYTLTTHDWFAKVKHCMFSIEIHTNNVNVISAIRSITADQLLIPTVDFVINNITKLVGNDWMKKTNITRSDIIDALHIRFLEGINNVILKGRIELGRIDNKKIVLVGGSKSIVLSPLNQHGNSNYIDLNKLIDYIIYLVNDFYIKTIAVDNPVYKVFLNLSNQYSE